MGENGVNVVDHGLGEGPPWVSTTAQGYHPPSGEECSAEMKVVEEVSQGDAEDMSTTPRCSRVQVHGFQLGLAEEAGEEELCVLPNLSTSTTLKRFRTEKEAHRRNPKAYNQRLVDIFFAEERVEQCRTVRLTEALRLLGPLWHSAPVEILKIDVEGAEVAVLRDLDRDDWRRVRRLAADLHSPEIL